MRKTRNGTNQTANAAVSGISKLSGEHVGRTAEAQKRSEALLKLTRELLPKYGPNWHRHSLATLKVEAMARLIYYNNLYQKIVEVPGVICEFGVQWGATLAQLINLRSLYEPFNMSRVIYGFDTFEGFASVNRKDTDFSKPGDYASQPDHEKVLEEILAMHESFAPHSHIKKFSLIKGDVTKTFPAWLKRNPHAIISMAIFDMDLYEPTKSVLQQIAPRLTKGSLLVFDELNCKHFPGETIALSEVLGLNNLKLKRTPLQPFCAWACVGD